jgi:amino acid permease
MSISFGNLLSTFAFSFHMKYELNTYRRLRNNKKKNIYKCVITNACAAYLLCILACFITIVSLNSMVELFVHCVSKEERNSR